ncbi:MAG: hypothetical protein ACI8ZM_000330, partial [Crocinitomix sp.]
MLTLSKYLNEQILDKRNTKISLYPTQNTIISSYQKVNCFDLERMSSRLAQEKIYEFTFVKEKAQLLKIKHNAKISLYPTQNTIISS